MPARFRRLPFRLFVCLASLPVLLPAAVDRDRLEESDFDKTVTIVYDGLTATITGADTAGVSVTRGAHDSGVSITSAVVAATSARAQIYITEFMYNGSEFVEFTNVGTTAIDMTGWSFDDDSALAGTIDLSAFGVVDPGESVILSEVAADAFRALWSLDASVAVIGDNTTTNLGRADTINLFDTSGTLVDTLTYDDQTISGSIRANGVSGTTAAENLGSGDILLWQLSVAGVDGAITSTTGGYVASPGTYTSGSSAVPEPATWALLAALAGFGALRHRHSRAA